MSSLTLSVPDELKHKMEKFKYINWSEISRAAIIDKIKFLEKMNKLFSRSALTKDDTIKYGRMIKKRQWAKTKRMLK